MKNHQKSKKKTGVSKGTGSALNLVLRLREFVRCKLWGPRQLVWKHPVPTETALPLEPSEKIFCDAEISSCSRCSCYPVVPPLHLLRTSRPGPSSTLRSRRSLRSLARCAATKWFSNILKINEKSINITTKNVENVERGIPELKKIICMLYISMKSIWYRFRRTPEIGIR